VSTAEGKEGADTAMECLRRAAAGGYRNTNELRVESAFEPLRSRDDFRHLVLDLAFPVNPLDRGE
jgi:hypothetical protein